MYIWRERANPRQSTFSWDDYSHVMALKPKIGQSTLHSFLGWSGKNIFLHWYNGLITSFELLETVMLEITFSSGHFIIHANKFSSLFLFLSTSLNLASLTWMKGPEQIAFWPIQFSSKSLKHWISHTFWRNAFPKKAIGKKFLRLMAHCYVPLIK